MTSPFVGSPVTGNSQNFDLCLSNIFLGLKVNNPRLKTALSIEIQINGMIFLNKWFFFNSMILGGGGLN